MDAQSEQHTSAHSCSAESERDSDDELPGYALLAGIYVHTSFIEAPVWTSEPAKEKCSVARVRELYADFAKDQPQILPRAFSKTDLKFSKDVEKLADRVQAPLDEPVSETHPDGGITARTCWDGDRGKWRVRMIASRSRFTRQETKFSRLPQKFNFEAVLKVLFKLSDWRKHGHGKERGKRGRDRNPAGRRKRSQQQAESNEQ
eukprot:TRINITY_DN26102_c0_g1_i1.p1 TRINITY_DN26102_c0_g1~~TRINITY_DN26102_c0_g1_i1.p1  ORF type:complete len:203 (+),score=28.99 TRINITY_DN26102_c0_g1_i1:93-701(+)